MDLKPQQSTSTSGIPSHGADAHDVGVNLPRVAGTAHYRIDPADDLLLARVNRSLISTGRRPLAQLKVTAVAGQVRLEGTVPSYYLKQLAQHAAMSVAGVERLESLLSVE